MPQSSCGTYILNQIPAGIPSRVYFAGYIVSAAAATQLHHCALEDARRYVYNGTASLLSAISGILTQQSAWSITKLYYAAFYFGRAALCRLDHIIFHAPRLPGTGFTQYEVKAKAGQQVSIVSNPPSTHKLVATRFSQYGYPPFMTGLVVDGMDPFQWLMEKREYWQYRAARFPDPDYPPELDKFDIRRAQRLLDEYSQDTKGVYLSDPAHAIISIPFRLAVWALSQESLISAGTASEDDIKYLQSRCHVGKQTLTAIKRHIG